MARALNLLRPGLHYRREAFDAGLRAAGLTLVAALEDPGPEDVLLIWNRYGRGHDLARRFEAVGALVLVAENCPLGNDWRPGAWYSLAKANPLTVGGGVPLGDGARWASWGVELAPWRQGGDEVVVLGQRSIGNERTASPAAWAQRVARRIGGRVREHPGTRADTVSLEVDLAQAHSVATWASAAAAHALRLGVPVWNEHPGFVGAAASQPLARYGVHPPLKDDWARLAVFERMARAIWELEEVRTGEPIRRLLAWHERTAGVTA